MATIERAIPVGGASLNFKVIASSTVPDSPTENTIWVYTSDEMTSWVFSAAEPDTPTEGMVWIKTGSNPTVAFNALKNNGIVVCPITAKQYISGAWASKTAKTYMNGAWQSWITYAVLDGTVNTQVAGTLDFTTEGAAVSYESGYIHITTTTRGTAKANFALQIDFTDIETVEIDIYSQNGTYRAAFVGVSATADPFWRDDTNNTVGGLAQCVAYADLENGAEDSRHTVQMDVSEVSGSFYLCFCFVSTGGGVPTDNKLYSVAFV